MKLKNVTAYDQKALRALNLASIKVSRRWKSLVWRVLGALWAASLLFNARYLGPNLLGILDAVLGTAVLVWVFFLNYIRAWMGVKDMKGPKEYTACFREEDYTLSDGREEVRIPYDSVYAVYEGRDYFFLMQNTRQGHIFSKDGFQEGGCEAFRSFVQERFEKVIPV